VGRGAVAVLDVEDNDALHQILNEWADIVPAHFDTYPLKSTLKRQSGCWQRKRRRKGNEVKDWFGASKYVAYRSWSCENALRCGI
jgi:hypothetical protein